MGNEQKDAQSAQEQFVWMNRTFAVSQMVSDIAAGTLRPKADRFSSKLIESYAEKVLCVQRGITSGPAYGMLVGVDYDRMLALPDAAYAQPALLAYAGKNKGILNIDGTGPHYVLVDGNHRMGRAYLDAREGVDVLILSAAQSRRYCQ